MIYYYHSWFCELTGLSWAFLGALMWLQSDNDGLESPEGTTGLDVLQDGFLAHTSGSSGCFHTASLSSRAA